MTTPVNPESPSFASRRLRAIAAFDAKVKQEREQRYQRNFVTAAVEVTPEISSAVTSAAVGSRWGAHAGAVGVKPTAGRDSEGQRAMGRESVLHMLKSGDEAQVSRACELTVACGCHHSAGDKSNSGASVNFVPTPTPPKASHLQLHSPSSFVAAAVAAARAGFPGSALRVLDCL